MSLDTFNTQKNKHTQRLKVDKKAFFYPEQLQRILDLTNLKQRHTIYCLLNTGARINEIRHADEKDIDSERKTLLLRITKTRAKLKETRPTPRTIPISTWFYKYFKKNVNEYKILSTNATKIMLNKYSKEIGMTNYQDMSAHNLRKTFGTWMLALNVDGFKLAQHLGHSPDMLRTHYASPDIFNFKDKDIMRELLDDLPSRMRSN